MKDMYQMHFVSSCGLHDSHNSLKWGFQTSPLKSCQSSTEKGSNHSRAIPKELAKPGSAWCLRSVGEVVLTEVNEVLFSWMRRFSYGPQSFYCQEGSVASMGPRLCRLLDMGAERVLL
eukprot:1807265-Amphidinium_carterae.1